jgi:hypothetical protein
MRGPPRSTTWSRTSARRARARSCERRPRRLSERSAPSSHLSIRSVPRSPIHLACLTRSPPIFPLVTRLPLTQPTTPSPCPPSSACSSALPLLSRLLFSAGIQALGADVTAGPGGRLREHQNHLEGDQPLGMYAMLPGLRRCRCRCACATASAPAHLVSIDPSIEIGCCPALCSSLSSQPTAAWDPPPYLVVAAAAAAVIVSALDITDRPPLRASFSYVRACVRVSSARSWTNVSSSAARRWRVNVSSHARSHPKSTTRSRPAAEGGE